MLRELHPIPNSDSVPLAEAAVHFQHELRRAAGREGFLGEWGGVMGNADNRVCGVDEDDVQR